MPDRGPRDSGDPVELAARLERRCREDLPRLQAARRYVEIRDRLKGLATVRPDLKAAFAEAEEKIKLAEEETVVADKIFARRWAPRALARYEVALAHCVDYLPAQIGAHAARTFGPPSRRPLYLALGLLLTTVAVAVAAFRWVSPPPLQPEESHEPKSAGYLSLVESAARRPPGTLLRTYVGHTQPITCLSVDRSGYLAASGGLGGELKVWDIVSGKETVAFAGHDGEISTLLFSAEGDAILAGGADGAVELWDTTTGQLTQTFAAHTGRILAAAWLRDERRMTTVGTDGLKVWNMSKERVVRSVNFQPGQVVAAAIGLRGRKILTAGPGPEAIVNLYDLETSGPARELTGERGQIQDLAMNKDGRFALSGDADHAVRMWDLEAGHEMFAMRGHAARVESVAFGPDDRYLLSTGADGSVRLWDRVKLQEMLKLTGPKGRVTCVSFTLGGRFAISGGEDHNLRLWKLWEGSKGAP